MEILREVMKFIIGGGGGITGVVFARWRSREQEKRVGSLFRGVFIPSITCGWEKIWEVSNRQ
jgi:hypothetical protein